MEVGGDEIGSASGLVEVLRVFPRGRPRSGLAVANNYAFASFSSLTTTNALATP